MPHWAIVGASRGIGLEFVKQLLARGDNVTATIRGDLSKASNLWTFAGSSDQGSCRLLECDVKSDLSISVRHSRITALPKVHLTLIRGLHMTSPTYTVQELDLIMSLSMPVS